MEDNLKQKRDNQIKKLVSNCRAILTNQIGLPLGVQKMNLILFRIKIIEPISDLDLSVFNEFDSKTQTFAIGSERLEYSKDFLQKQDQELDKITAHYKNDVMDKCFEIIKYFENIKSSKLNSQ